MALLRSPLAQAPQNEEWRARSTRLTPMAALSLAATAVGLLYTEVAAAHEGDNSCPCGWEPRSAADLEALQTSLALATKPPHANFHAIQVEGHA